MVTYFEVIFWQNILSIFLFCCYKKLVKKSEVIVKLGSPSIRMYATDNTPVCKLYCRVLVLFTSIILRSDQLITIK